MRVDLLANVAFRQVVDTGRSGHLDVKLFRVVLHGSQNQLDHIRPGLEKVLRQREEFVKRFLDAAAAFWVSHEALQNLLFVGRSSDL